MSPVRVKYQ